MITAKVFADNREMANIHVIKAIAYLPCPPLPNSQLNNLQVANGCNCAASGPTALRPFLDIETIKAASISRPRSGKDRMSAIRWLTQSSFVPGKLI